MSLRRRWRVVLSVAMPDGTEFRTYGWRRFWTRSGAEAYAEEWGAYMLGNLPTLSGRCRYEVEAIP